MQYGSRKLVRKKIVPVPDFLRKWGQPVSCSGMHAEIFVFDSLSPFTIEIIGGIPSQVATNRYGAFFFDDLTLLPIFKKSLKNIRGDRVKPSV